jgi:hypothetical protein
MIPFIFPYDIPPFGPEAQQIPMPIPLKFKEEFPLVASMGDIPDVPRNVMSLCPCYIKENRRETALFALEKLIIGPIQRAQNAISHAISDTSRGPTPSNPSNFKLLKDWIPVFTGNPGFRLPPE